MCWFSWFLGIESVINYTDCVSILKWSWRRVGVDGVPLKVHLLGFDSPEVLSKTSIESVIILIVCQSLMELA